MRGAVIVLGSWRIALGAETTRRRAIRGDLPGNGKAHELRTELVGLGNRGDLVQRLGGERSRDASCEIRVISAEIQRGTSWIVQCAHWSVTPESISA